ncbi:MAG: DUF4153 domain-containing protein [Bacteroidota bacterium]
MKRKDLCLIIATAIYSFLFYRQSAGINFLLFSIVLTIMQIVLSPNWKTNKKIIVAAIASILSGVSVMLYGNTLAVISNITSLSMLVAFSTTNRNSIISASINTVYSYASSFIYIMIDWVDRSHKRKNEKNENAPKNSISKVWFFVIPIFLFIVFFIFYQNSNPIFKDFTKKINLDFISLSWINFTFWGFVWLYGYFYFRNIGFVNSWEIKENNLTLEELPEDKDTFWGRILNLQNKNMIGLSTLIMLNLLLFIVNILDVQYIWIQQNLPARLTFAEFIHNGIGTLILSIIMAIIIILVLFKGKINFFEQNKTIKMLAYIWIAQNIILIISNLLKNQMYIEVFGFTYKRIGVYIWLIMALGGLISTIYKIYAVKSNWFLFRANGWIGFSVLVVASLFNWDMLIVKYNLTKSESPDKSYILELSPEVLPFIIESDLYKNSLDETFQPKDDWYNTYRTYDQKKLKEIIDIKLIGFLNNYVASDWRSITLREINTYNRLKKLNNEKKIKSISINEYIYQSDIALKYLNNVNELSLKNIDSNVVKSINTFNSLSILKLEQCNIKDIQSLPDSPKITELSLANNTIQNLKNLDKYPMLEILDISGNSTINMATLPAISSLKEINISENTIKTMNWTSNTSNLSRLIAKNIVVQFDSIPCLNGLTFLDLSNNNISSEHYNFFKKLQSMKNINDLVLSGNKLDNLLILTSKSLLGSKMGQLIENDEINNRPLFEQLKVLDVSDNSLSSLKGINNYKKLERLNISNNTGPNDFSELQELIFLKDLNASKTQLNIVNFLEKNVNLEKLNISSCSSNGLELKGIEKLKNLRVLDLSVNSIIDIKYLTELKNLEELNIVLCVTNYIGLENVKASILYISYSDNFPIEILKKMKSLKTLYVNGADATQLHIIKKELSSITVKPFRIN